MPEDKSREYGHDPVPAKEEKGLQPIQPVSIVNDPDAQDGLQPIRVLPSEEGGSDGEGGENQGGDD